MVYTIHGRIPSKKNSKRIVMFGHRPAIISSKDYESWHTIASYELALQKKKSGNIAGPFSISITFHGENARKFDVSNKAESIMDLLVDNGIIADDNWSIVPELHLFFAGIDKNDPRAEISIT